MASAGFSSCGSPSDVVQVPALTLSPDPPQPGYNLTVDFDATVSDVIQVGAYIWVEVKLGYIVLIRKTFDLCEQATQLDAQYECPLAAGDYTVHHEIELPKEIPPGKFVVTAKGHNPDDSPLFCVKEDISFRKSA
ncbi:hypothetical protein GLOTRDRAFT_124488 [Gloeophyllum trabeum ATCC 11539]|uniref:Phosphatidylglycerol/phosphatidylinositol transfer protein n=1 Tax=Gloeophyllum trabeum (strain ATCC 11539 / FP-39264 / Madison 617) TaxID=670483 RepID=S7QMW0_GLOTA|nr:uncharacterized protein GLOTRDRAFT_124488 [Gloeophyllum trabeum ATCC 11539]EPQ60742.1 hypothetical protein GLOTRDRAFT_124488 [Gloeophyllum trabeum ATCC 11539]